jgi:hypothetical protein
VQGADLEPRGTWRLWSPLLPSDGLGVGAVADGPPPAAPALRPTSSAVAWATVPRGSSGSSAAGDTSMATRVAAAKEAVDAATAKEATEEAIEIRRPLRRQRRRMPPRRW